MTQKDGNNDPTANVLQLVAAAVDRLEDLRKAETERIRELMALEAKRLDDRMDMMASNAKELNVAEAKRIDAIRAVDVSAVATATERATAQAAVLATQVSQSAETLRSLVAQTAATVAQQLAQVSQSINDRLVALERANYEGAGKSRLADPQMEMMLQEIKRLQENQATKQGSGDGMKALWGIIAGLILLGIAVIGFAGKL